MWFRFYVEYKVGVCIIDTIPHCHAEMLSKGAKSRNVASFLYSGTTEYVSSIVFHTVILNKLSKEAKSRNVASLLLREKLEYVLSKVFHTAFQRILVWQCGILSMIHIPTFSSI